VTSADHLLLHGATEPLPERIALNAGPFTLAFEAGDIRYVSIGDHEVVRRIYGAVRDRFWGTVPGRIRELRIAERQSDFEIAYCSEHVADPIDFVWNARIRGHEDGTIVFDFAGLARSTFYRNRIGLCTLHPIRECAGRRALVTSVTGSVSEVVLPAHVAIEQPVSGFSSLRRLEYEVEPGCSVQFEFEGDTFEMEDQRNWIDASFKTYSTPLSLPRPVEISAGTRITQRVTLRLKGLPAPTSSYRDPAGGRARVEIAGTATRRMPKIGVGINGSVGTSAPIVDAIKSLGPAHFRVDLHLASDWRTVLRDAVALHHSTGSEIELALHVDDHSNDALTRLGEELPRPHGLARVLIFSAERAVTSPEAMMVVERALLSARSDLPPFGSGSRADMYELHLTPPPDAAIVCWSMNPHAHASDVTSLAETPPAAGEQIASLLARQPAARVVITPVTLEPRASRDDVDPLLTKSIFGGSWALAIASRLSQAGAEAITFFDRASCLAAAAAGNAPVLQVLTTLCGLAGGMVIPLTSPDTLHSLLVRTTNGDTLLLANLTPRPTQVSLPAEFQPVTVQDLSSPSPPLISTTSDTDLLVGPFRTVRVAGFVNLPRQEY
jgi:D-apionolactonase